MRHRVDSRTFGRKSNHRKALFKNLATALIQEESIRTTTTKAKELRRVVEKLITLGKRGDLHSKRLAYQKLGNHDVVKHLFDDVAPRFSSRPGGYTRIFRLANPRRGDSAEMSIIEFVEKKLKVAVSPEEKKKAKKKPRETEKKAATKKAVKKASKKVESRVEEKTEAKPKAVAPEVKKETFREKLKRTFGIQRKQEEKQALSEQKESQNKLAEKKMKKIHRKTGRNN